jgi:hypothetical protein
MAARFASVTRRQALAGLAAGTGSLALLGAGIASAAEPRTPVGRDLGRTVRDRLWVWAHAVGSYDNAYGLPANSRLAPVDGARYLGVPNLILIRYGDHPRPPFEEYAAPFRSLDRVFWSVTGAGGVTSEEERAHVFRLAAGMPNLVGLFMDDFFHLAGNELPQWLAANDPTFPVTYAVKLPEPVAATRLELTQSDWHTGDYRSAAFAVDLPDGADTWRELAQGLLPNQPAATAQVTLPGLPTAAIRLRFLGTHDLKDARSCGLRRLRLWAGDQEVSLNQATAEASSTYPGFDPQAAIQSEIADARPAPAALTPEDLRSLRQRLVIGDRRLDLAVTLYTHQLSPRILPHLESCDVVSLWTWKAQDLHHLESNFARFRELAPTQRVLLGCYLWDFGTGQPMPLELMKRQTELGLQWLRAGQVEGLIFLATNVLDLGLETVAWTREWIAAAGPQAL